MIHDILILSATCGIHGEAAVKQENANNEKGDKR